VVCKAMVSFVLARAFLDKFGGDNITDMRLAFSAYVSYCHSLGSRSGSIAARHEYGGDEGAESE
ncbi:MAG TPA: hypothetical protein V6D08_15355, partial [Candidatus Obscuribacterales bacterium]